MIKVAKSRNIGKQNALYASKIGINGINECVADWEKNKAFHGIMRQSLDGLQSPCMIPLPNGNRVLCVLASRRLALDSLQTPAAAPLLVAVCKMANAALG